MEKKICVFFGHRDCPETVKSQIRQAVVEYAALEQTS